MDTFVFKVSVAIPLVCLAGLLLWHLAAYLIGPKKPRTVRHSPEPPSAIRSPKLLPGVDSLGNDAERLEKACAALEDKLADTYLELAESWLRQGQSQHATAAWKKILQICPERRQAKIARDRLQQIASEVGDRHS